jgi:DNA-binding XRE family transcriptional regulator
MSELSDRLKQARMDAGYRTTRDAAASLGIVYATYAGHENGNRAFDIDAAKIYARKFKVSLEWLLGGKGDPYPNAAMIRPEVIRAVLVHMASEYPQVISADPNQFAAVVIDLCEFLQASHRDELERGVSALAMKRMTDAR